MPTARTTRVPTLNATGGYPRTYMLPAGVTMLATSQGGSPVARCNLFSTRDALNWTAVSGPAWTVPAGTDLSNCAPGAAPDGSLLVGVRHHNGAEALAPPQWGAGARPWAWTSASTFRIQVVRQPPGHQSWEASNTVYATHDRDHAAWEPVFFQSLDGSVLRVVYSLERPADFTPPACEPQTNYPGADLVSASAAPSAALCQGRCVGVAECVAWSWRRTDSACWLKGAGHGTVADAALDSGAKLCGAGTGGEESAAMVEAAARAAAAEPRQGGVAVSRHPDAPREQDIVMQESRDSGRTFGPVRVLSRTAGSRDGMPSVARQRDGCLIVVYEGFGGTAWGRFTVNAIRSCDDGRSWRKTSVFPKGGAAVAHAPTIALLADGRAAVASYDAANAAQLQVSRSPLEGDTDAVWGAPRVVVPSPAAWPDVFSMGGGGDERLWVAYGRGGESLVAAVNASSRPPAAAASMSSSSSLAEAVATRAAEAPAAAAVLRSRRFSVRKGAGSTSAAACDDLHATNTSWWYDWTPSPRHCAQVAGHVPMIWGRSDVASINTSVDRGADDALLGFNEPDNCNGQSCMTVDEAVALWPRLVATGMRLGSPAVTTGGGSWLGKFLFKVGCGPGATPPCHVDFLALHYYGQCDAQSLYDFLAAWSRPYPSLPIWLTEFSCPDFTGAGTVAANLAFMRAALPGIGAAAPALERYAWFATRTYKNDGAESGYENCTLFNASGVGEAALTVLGRTYRQL